MHTHLAIKPDVAEERASAGSVTGSVDQVASDLHKHRFYKLFVVSGVRDPHDRRDVTLASRFRSGNN